MDITLRDLKQLVQNETSKLRTANNAVTGEINQIETDIDSAVREQKELKRLIFSKARDEAKDTETLIQKIDEYFSLGWAKLLSKAESQFNDCSKSVSELENKLAKARDNLSEISCTHAGKLEEFKAKGTELATIQTQKSYRDDVVELVKFIDNNISGDSKIDTALSIGFFSILFSSKKSQLKRYAKKFKQLNIGTLPDVANAIQMFEQEESTCSKAVDALMAEITSLAKSARDAQLEIDDTEVALVEAKRKCKELDPVNLIEKLPNEFIKEDLMESSLERFAKATSSEPLVKKYLLNIAKQKFLLKIKLSLVSDREMVMKAYNNLEKNQSKINRGASRKPSKRVSIDVDNITNSVSQLTTRTKKKCDWSQRQRNNTSNYQNQSSDFSWMAMYFVLLSDTAFADSNEHAMSLEVFSDDVPNLDVQVDMAAVQAELADLKFSTSDNINLAAVSASVETSINSELSSIDSAINSVSSDLSSVNSCGGSSSSYSGSSSSCGGSSSSCGGGM